MQRRKILRLCTKSYTFKHKPIFIPMPACLKSYICLALLACLLIAEGCKKNSPSTTQPVVATLKATAPFPMGSAITSNGILSNYFYQGVLLTEYNSMTADYEMKFDITEPKRGAFNYAPGDAIVGFAAQHHLRMHGHNFIWHQALPDWVLNFQGDTPAWETLFKTHIQSEATHYKGQVASWDVVNEAIRDDNGQLRNQDVSPGDGTGSIWRQHLGPDYIARAFQYAHEADPGALLFYNDYGQEWGGVKLDSMIALVTGLKNRGIPISGIGMQMHIDINVDTAGITSALKRLAATGLLVHISELDISVNPGNDPNIVFTSALQLKQSALYQFIAESYRKNVPAAQRYGITTWEFCDADSWIPPFFNRKDWPLPFDATYKKKPAYFGLLKGLTN
ncbi:endo-1,4-beta-xylanase [uncultured Mucilaginibacter sp.]|uniref:endo-1,4-beta-xylanase n=1 Tax=uncultured Mucilaginibacter sp. TaxID=797541 RepID=UPI0025E11374|nr:endo-1,4-beta-xylanase [uncultured Mucilaginibacter sp.]